MQRAGLIVLADDLTGACEAALAARETGGRAVTTLGPPVGPAWDLVAVDLDARDGLARAGAMQWTPGREPVLKIDSTLRGPLPALVARFAAAARAEVLVVAPALPARGRVTRDGILHLVGSDDPPVAVRSAIAAYGIETVVPDVEEDADLDRAVAHADASGRRVGWVGSAGLVAALARARLAERGPVAPPRLEPGPVLVAAGSTTAETARQVATLLARDDVDLRSSPKAAAASLRAGRHVLFRSAPPRALAEIARRVQASRLLLTGGATARAVCEAVGIEALEVLGAAADGAPLSRELGGERLVVTKAGRFGPPDALSTALDRLAGSAS